VCTCVRIFVIVYVRLKLCLRVCNCVRVFVIVYMCLVCVDKGRNGILGTLKLTEALFAGVRSVA